MRYSNSHLEDIGFRALGPSETVQGRFFRLHVFQIRGLSLETPTPVLIEESIDDIPFKVGFGSKINEVCKLIIGDEYVSDEKKWMEEKKFLPPFMLLVIGPTRELVGKGTHIIEDEESIETYESFLEARLELREISDRLIPKLLTSLSIGLSSEAQSVRFIPGESEVVGKSADGRWIHDISVSAKFEVSVSTNISNDELRNEINSSLIWVKNIETDTARFYYLGANEEDALKKFLYFFILIERLVHSTFKNIDHDQKVKELMSQYSHVEDNGLTLFGSHRKTWTDLRTRFIWCVMHRWIHLTDSDIERFDRIKKTRDHISHGELTSPGKEVFEIQDLVLRIMRNF